MKMTIEIVAKRDQHVFEVLPRRWVVERTFAWISKHRRTVRDYEHLPASHEAMILRAMIALMTRRLTQPTEFSDAHLGGPGRAGVARCQVLTKWTRLLVSSLGDPRATPLYGARHGRRDAYAAAAHATLGRRLAVAGSDGIMLLSGMSARARRVWRRIAAGCCRHKVALS
jgi:Transposase DDE domain